MFLLFAILIFVAVIVASVGAALHKNAAGTRALQERLVEGPCLAVREFEDFAVSQFYPHYATA